jgi:hypothetical protein
MKLRKAKSRRRKDGAWYIICPVCKSRITLDECPSPRGMTFNVEFCNNCSAEIEVQP